MPSLSCQKHLEVLTNRVFEVNTRYPQFKLLLDDLLDLSTSHTAKNVVALERTLLYGGFSLFAPLFSSTSFSSIDCSPPSADHRGAYNSEMINDEDFIKYPFDIRCYLPHINYPSSTADLVIIPNLVHHVADQHAFFKEATRILKPNGMLYIFEPLVRELHQEPDDYIRYTPYGLENLLRSYSFDAFKTSTIGGPFQVIDYCWQQALQYLPADLRAEYQHWLQSEHRPKLSYLDRTYKTNIVKTDSSFPTAFSLTSRKTSA